MKEISPMWSDDNLCSNTSFFSNISEKSPLSTQRTFLWILYTQRHVHSRGRGLASEDFTRHGDCEWHTTWTQEVRWDALLRTRGKTNYTTDYPLMIPFLRRGRLRKAGLKCWAKLSAIPLPGRSPELSWNWIPDTMEGRKMTKPLDEEDWHESRGRHKR